VLILELFILFSHDHIVRVCFLEARAFAARPKNNPKRFSDVVFRGCQYGLLVESFPLLLKIFIF
jgi:hypothetical protein